MTRAVTSCKPPPWLPDAQETYVLSSVDATDPTTDISLYISTRVREMKLKVASQRQWWSNRGSKKVDTAGSASGGVLDTTKHLLAGAMAAMVSRTAVAPLERLKLEYMVRGARCHAHITVARILRREGPGGFWKGNTLNLLRTAPFKAINLFAFDHYRAVIVRLKGTKDLSNFERLVSGAAAGVTATVLCFPLDTLRTRVVAQGGCSFQHFSQCMKRLIRTEGAMALYQGLLPAVISMAPAGAVFYGTYDLLKSTHISSREKYVQQMAADHQMKKNGEAMSVKQLELGPVRTLLYGAIAGAAAETATYPFEVIRRHLQLQNAAQKLGLLATVQSIFYNGGPGAFYSGLLPSVLQVLPSAALSYFVYEHLKAEFKLS